MAEVATQPQNVFHLTPNVTVTNPVTADIPTFDLNTTEKENIQPDVAQVFNTPSLTSVASRVTDDVNNAIMAEEAVEEVSQDIHNIALEENHDDDNVTVSTDVSEPPVMIPHKALLSITRRLEILEEENKYLKKKVRKINNHVVATLYTGSGSEEDPIIIE